MWIVINTKYIIYKYSFGSEKLDEINYITECFSLSSYIRFDIETEKHYYFICG